MSRPARDGLRAVAPALASLQFLRTIPYTEHASDRTLLERELLPSLARLPGLRRCLFVGCAAYTQQYGLLFPGVEYWTMDPDPRRQCFGAQRHIIDRLENLSRHDTGGAFDLIVCNGVLGWGLNTRRQAEHAFAGCHARMRAGGHLLLGWNDRYPRNRVRPEDLGALSRFEHVPVGRYGARVPVAGWRRHVFDFYRKPDQAGNEMLRSASSTFSSSSIARSPSETMPTRLRLASTTGMRRICLSPMRSRTS